MRRASEAKGRRLREWRLVRYLEEGGGVGDVVADEALCGDADLVLADGGGFGPRLLHPLVPIHGSFLRQRSRRGGCFGGGGGGVVVVVVVEGKGRGGGGVLVGLKP